MIPSIAMLCFHARKDDSIRESNAQRNKHGRETVFSPKKVVELDDVASTPYTAGFDVDVDAPWMSRMGDGGDAKPYQSMTDVSIAVSTASPFLRQHKTLAHSIPIT